MLTTSYWLAESTNAPAVRGPSGPVDVAVVGGGVTGCACALSLAERGLIGSGALRWTIWDDERVEPWYRQNLLVFGGDLILDGCPYVIHPGIWTCYR